MDDLLSEVNESQSRDMTWWGCPHSTRATASCHQGLDFTKPLFLSLILPFFFPGMSGFREMVGKGRYALLSESGSRTLVPCPLICLWKMPSP